MEEKSIDLKENNNGEIPKAHFAHTSRLNDLITTYSDKVVFLYGKGSEYRQIGKTYLLLKETIKNNGIYITDSVRKLDSIKKYSQNLEFYQDGEFYFNKNSVSILISDSVKGKLFSGKSIFVDLDIPISQIDYYKILISDLRSRNAIVSGICRIQVPYYDTF